MASFLARFTTAKTQPVPDVIPEPAGADARALQAKLTAALGDLERSSDADADADLLALYGQYREARKDMHKVFAERVDSDAEADLIVGRRDALLREIAKMPAKTLRGFGAKMEVLRSCECPALEKACPQEPDAILLQSIVADSYWLFSAEETTKPRKEAKDDASTDHVDNRSNAVVTGR
ncbi:hypothetical protein [Taklimakanibacter deserti]|uniref:hypothetical protein n=1 Tax=Taklimakanibacter deserti TaxID=2267839 RepID=UPI000E65304B